MGSPRGPLSDRHSAFKYNARQVPVLVESTQFARVIRELGIRQVFALSPSPREEWNGWRKPSRTVW